MSFLKSLIEKSRKSLKYSVSDPSTFEETWSFTGTRIQVISLLLIVIFVVGFGTSYLFSFLFGGADGNNDTSIERKKLEDQRKKIELLSAHVKGQEQYIGAIKRILSGEVPIESNLDSLKKVTKVDYGTFNTKPSKSEILLSERVKDDMRTTNTTESAIPFFSAPVFGVISQKFDRIGHPGVDIVTELNKTVKACLSGTVIYSGYSRLDGYVLIIDHGRGYMSVYKHAKKSLKKIGDRVQLGDPIAIVGNSGENTDGPHLHFELWYNQVPVNPDTYLNFKR